MKNKSLTILGLLVTLTLVLTLNVSAQQNAQVRQQKSSASLERSLAQLGQGLKQSVVSDLNQWTGPKKTYVRLKQRGGCAISFQVSEVPSVIYATSRQAVDLSVWELKVNLGELENSEIVLPLQGDYKVILFSTIGGKESIRRTGVGVDVGRWSSVERIKIEEKYASQVAAALQQAIIACRA